MTDEELLELLQNKTPAELSVAEIDLLARRMRTSAEFRAALADQVELESYLAGALGQLELSAESIMSQAAASSTRRFPLWPALGIGACVLLLIVAAYFVWPQVFGAGDAKQNQLAQDEKPAGPFGLPQGESPPRWGDPIEGPPQTDPVVPSPVVENKPAPPRDKPKPPAVVEPWNRESQLAAPPRPWEEVASDGFPRGVEPPTPADATRWFGPHVWRTANLVSNNQNVRAVTLDGAPALIAPWRDDVVLRIALAEPQRLRFFFYRGERGVALCYYDWPRPAWAVYAVTRPATKDDVPQFRSLLATDEERAWRTTTGQNPLLIADLRFTGKEMVLGGSGGVLLQAPFVGLPEETIFDGSAKLRALAMVRTDGAPPMLPPARPVARDVKRPADLPWDISNDARADALFTKLPEGDVELSEPGKKAELKATASFPLAMSSPREIVFKVQHATPGGRIFLGEKGQPRVTIGFLQTKIKDALLLANLFGADEKTMEGDANIATAVVPLTSPQPWIKLVYGCGGLRVWCSDDGLQWVRCGDPVPNLNAQLDCAGLMLAKGNGARSIGLTNVQFREFPRVKALASDELVATAPIVKAEWKNWLPEVAKLCPPKGELPDWKRACAVRVIAESPNRDLSNEAARWLYEDSLNQPATIDERFALLDELATLSDLSDDTAARAFAALYERTGRLALLEGQSRPFTRTEGALFAAPIWTKGAAYPLVSDALARAELIELVYANRGAEVLQVANRLRSLGWNDPNNPGHSLLEWAESAAAQQLDRTDLLGVAAPYRRNPLIEETSKEGYNILAELDAALAAEAYRDAGQVISTVAGKDDLGMLPDSRDPQLLLSLPGRIALAMQEHPEMRKVMSDQFGPLASLRMKQAIAAGDSVQVAAILAQFPGTDAAGQARLWLGDRLLASGDAAQAAMFFRAARESAGPVDTERLSWRLRLAAAMLGDDAEQPPSTPVDFGGERLSPQDFEALVASVRGRKQNLAGAADVSGPYNAPCRAAPPPAMVTMVKRNALEGDVGSTPADMQHFARNRLAVDWCGRQLAAAAVNGQLVVNNRFHVAAYNATTGELNWRNDQGQGSQGSTHDWSLAPMRPVVAGGQVYARQLTKAGPQLAAFKLDGGKLLSITRANLMIASDPVVVDGQCFAVTATLKEKEQEWLLQLAAFNPANLNELRWERPLLKLRENWSYLLKDAEPRYSLRVCQLAAGTGHLVVEAGGVAAGCDLTGNVRWIRRGEWVPFNDDPTYAAQHQQPPLIVGDTAFLQQPGVKSITAVSVETGRLLWRRILPNVRRIVGGGGERVIVETDDGLLAFSASTGETLWNYPVEDALEGVLCGAPGGICLSRLESQKGPSPHFRRALVWIDAATGKETARHPVEEWGTARTLLGPLVNANDRLWAFAADNDSEPNRRLYEVVAKEKSDGG